MYKKIALLLCCALFAAALAGCSTGGGNPASSGEGGEAPAGSGSVELKMLFWDSNQEVGLKAMADGFMAKHPEYRVTVQTIPWEEYWTKLQASAMGGDMPDIVVMHPDEVEKYAEGGMLMDLTELLTTSELTGLDRFPSYVNEDFQVDGSYYGVPKDIGTMALLYNKDLFDEAGVAYPDDSWTWDDMMAAAGQITNKDKDIYGFAAPNDGQNFYWNLIWQNGGDLFTEDGKSAFGSPEVVEAMNYAVSFVENGYTPTVSDFANLSEVEYFAAGKVGMIFAGSWMLTQYLSTDGLNFDVAQLPQQVQRAAICSGMAFSVASSTKQPEAALKLVEYLGSEEAQTIQAESGVAIPAYEGTQGPWIDGFDTIDASPYAKAAEYGHTSPGLTTSNEAAAVVNNYMPEIFALRLPVEEGLKKMAEEIDALAS